MFNEYYPENTSPDCFENYGGHHIDDRMRARGNSYASLCRIDGNNSQHYATSEKLEDKKAALKSLQNEYAALRATIYGEGGRERMAGEELANALMPLEALAVKIANIQRFIATAHVVSGDEIATDRVRLLSKITVKVQGMEMPMTIRIVGENDANLEKREISCSSPVGKSLLGRKVGESVDVKIAGRVVRYNILSAYKFNS